jgi:hypothetical protein
VCIRTGLLGGLALPIDGGRRWPGRRLLGENKTLRGVVAVAPGTQPGGMLGLLFHALDQVDVVAGAGAVLLWVVKPLAGFALGRRATWR